MQKIQKLSHLVEETREHLLEVSKGNIQYRWVFWKDIVNKQTKETHNEWFFKEYKSYKFTKNLTENELEDSMQFIINWKGLRPLHSIPSTVKQYQHRSRNWLNGRRSMHFSRHLYPAMINHSEIFARRVSNTYFNDVILKGIPNTQSNEYSRITTKLTTLYHRILIYSYLVRLCTAYITSGCKTSHLLYARSMNSRKSETKRLLQKYCVMDTHCYPRTFPAHRKQAIDNFTKAINAAGKELKQLMDTYCINNIKKEEYDRDKNGRHTKNTVFYDYKKDDKMCNAYNNLPPDITNMFMNIINNGLKFQTECKVKTMDVVMDVVMDTQIMDLIQQHENNTECVCKHKNNGFD